MRINRLLSLVVILFLLLFLLPSRTFAIFRGFPSQSQQKRTTTTRFIIKFNDWSNPNVEMVNSVNESLGITTMRPLFTDRSVGIPVAYKPTSINLTNNQVIEKFSLISPLKKILSKLKFNPSNIQTFAQGGNWITFQGRVYCQDPGGPLIPMQGVGVSIAQGFGYDIWDQVNTDANGYYSFTEHPSGPQANSQNVAEHMYVLSIPFQYSAYIPGTPLAVNCLNNNICQPLNVLDTNTGLNWANSRCDQAPWNLPNQQGYTCSFPVNTTYTGLDYHFTNCVPPPSLLPACGQQCQQGICGQNNFCDVSVNVCKIPECLGQACDCTLPPPPPPLPPYPPPPVPVNEVFISADLQHFYIITLPANSNLTLEQIFSHYRTIPEFESAEPNHPLHDLASPNDTYYNQQWSLTKINMEDAWATASGKILTPVKVGVVDSGVDQNHQDLQGLTFSPGRDYSDCEEFSNNDSCVREKTCPKKENGYCSDSVADDNGHGTHVTGIIAGMINNSTGITGISGKVNIIPAKVLNSNGNTFESWTWEGIVFAVNQGAKVINLSIGGCASLTSNNGTCLHENSTTSKGFKKVLDYAVKRKVSVVVAAGNENDDAQWSTPPNYNNTLGTAGKIIVVGATGSNDERAFYSNYGRIVDIAAPGGNIRDSNDRNGDGQVETEDCVTQDCILSTFKPEAGGRFSDGNYESYMGTSMAAPHVSGLAALLYTLNPNLSGSVIASIIYSSADQITTDRPIGGKRINAAAAVDRAINFDESILYTAPACDLCGWCDKSTNPPQDWQKCHDCLYNEDGTENHNAHYTVFGCFEGSEDNPLAPQVVETTLSYVFGITGGLAFLTFLYGALLLTTSHGNHERIVLGNKVTISSVAGLLIIVFSVYILRVIGVDILQIPGFG